MSGKQIRWGILSTASIANKVVQAIQSSVDGKVVAVASRELSKAKEFATKWKIPTAYGSYNELLDDKEVDVIYIPLPTTMHAEWTTKCAEKGKHVLCEKPFAPTFDEAQRAIQVCEKHNVQFMDGVMWVHHKRTQLLKKEIQSLGQLTQVNTRFTTLLDDETRRSNIRLKKETEPLGALGDLGWYNIRAILVAYNFETPTKVFGTAVYDPTLKDSSPLGFNGTLWFSDNKMASFDCNFAETCWQESLTISGNLGMIHLDDFLLPSHTEPILFPHLPYKDTCSFTVSRKFGEKRVVDVEPCVQEVSMINDFNDIVKSGKLDKNWPNQTLLTQRIINALLESSEKQAVVHLQ